MLCFDNKILNCISRRKLLSVFESGRKGADLIPWDVRVDTLQVVRHGIVVSGLVSSDASSLLHEADQDWGLGSPFLGLATILQKGSSLSPKQLDHLTVNFSVGQKFQLKKC